MSQWVVPIAVALAAPIFAFLGITWKLSGRIDTSEAGQLWTEATNMRAEYLQRAKECETQLKACRNELQTITTRNAVLSRENSELRRTQK